jgi:hypothetical protein
VTPDLAAAIAAVLLAIAALIRDELARRRLQDAVKDNRRRVVDVQRKVGADRRPDDEPT